MQFVAGALNGDCTVSFKTRASHSFLTGKLSNKVHCTKALSVQTNPTAPTKHAHAIHMQQHSDGTSTLCVSPLARGHIALTSRPHTRGGPHRSHEAMPVFAAAMQAQDLPPPSNGIVNATDTTEPLIAGASLGSEREDFEFKMPRPSFDKTSNLDAYLLEAAELYMEPLLNAPTESGEVKLLLGVLEDGTSNCGHVVGIGYDMLDAKDPSHEGLNNWLNEVFPQLPSHSVHLRLRRVTVQLPATYVEPKVYSLSLLDDKDDNNDGGGTSSSAQVASPRWQRKEDACEELCNLKGRAEIFKQEEGQAVKYCLARSAEEMRCFEKRGLQPLTRVVVEICFRPPQHNRPVYFRTAPVRDEKEPHPTRAPHICASTHKVIDLDALGIWLRLQKAGPPLGVRVRGSSWLFFVLECCGFPAGEAQQTLAQVCGLEDRLNSHVLVKLDDEKRVKHLAGLLRERSTTRVTIMVCDGGEGQLCMPNALVDCLRHHAAGAEVVFATRLSNAHQAQKRLEQLRSQLGRVAVAAAVLASSGRLPVADDAGEPSLPPQVPHPPPQVPGFFTVPTRESQVEEPAATDLSRWLQNGEAPTWELVFADRIPFLSQWEAELRAVQGCLDQRPGLTVRQVCRRSAGSGCTTFLHVLARHLAAKGELAFFAHRWAERDVAPTFSSADGDVLPAALRTAITVGKGRAVFLFDAGKTAVSAHDCENALKKVLADLPDARVVVVRICGARQASGCDVELDPVLSRADCDKVVKVLKRFEAAPKQALDDLLEQAQRKDGRGTVFDRHLFVFGVTAARGCFTPVTKLAREIEREILQAREGDLLKQAAAGFATALVYTASFAHRRLCLPPRANGSGEAADVVRQLKDIPLFASLLVPDGSLERRALGHPVLARLLLLCLLGDSPGALASRGHLDWDRLVAEHMRTGKALRLCGVSLEDCRYIGKQLIVPRVGQTWFSNLLIQFANARVTKADLKAREDVVLKVLKDTNLGIDDGYVELQLARIVMRWSSWPSRQSGQQLKSGDISALRERAVELATSANEKLGTYDSFCTYVKARAHLVQRHGSFAHPDVDVEQARAVASELEQLWDKAQRDESSKVRREALCVCVCVCVRACVCINACVRMCDAHT